MVRRLLAGLIAIGVGVAIGESLNAVRVGAFGEAQRNGPPAVTSSCQDAPLHIGWQLGGPGTITGALVSGVSAACQGTRFELTVADAAGHVVDDVAGVTPADRSAFTIPLGAVAVNDARSVTLEVTG